MRPTVIQVVLIHPQLAEAVRLRQLILALGNYTARAFTTPETGLAYARDYPVDAVLIFSEFKSIPTPELVARLQVIHVSVKVIVMGASDEQAARMGAHIGLPLPVIGRNLKPALERLFPANSSEAARVSPKMAPPPKPGSVLPPITTAEDSALLGRLSAEEPEVVPPEEGGTLREPVTNLLPPEMLLQSQRTPVIELSEPSPEPLASTPVLPDALDADLTAEEAPAEQPVLSSDIPSGEVAVDALPVALPVIADAPAADDAFDEIQDRYGQADSLAAPQDDLDLVAEPAEISEPAAAELDEDDSAELPVMAADSEDSEEYDSEEYDSEEIDETPPPPPRKPLPAGMVLPGTRTAPTGTEPPGTRQPVRPDQPAHPAPAATRSKPYDDEAARRALVQVASATGASATALILARAGKAIAHAGEMPESEIEELRAVVNDDWQMSGTGSRMRYVTLPSSGQEYVLFTRRALDDLTLSLLFNSDQKLTDIRKQSTLVAERLAEMPPADAPVATVTTNPLVPLTVVWVVQDAAKPLTADSAQRIVSALDRALTDRGWAIHSLNVHTEYVYLFSDAPAEETVPVLMAELKSLSAQAAAPREAEPAAVPIWADAYLAIMPGRELAADEVRRFVNFSRMRAVRKPDVLPGEVQEE